MRIVITYTNGDVGVYSSAGESALSSDTIRPAGDIGKSFAVALEPRLSLLKEEGLVVDVYWYSTQVTGLQKERVVPSYPRPEYGKDFSLDSTLFTKGRVWRILDAEEISRAKTIDVDGIISLERIGPDLCNMTLFECAKNLWVPYVDQSGAIALDAQFIHSVLAGLNPDMEEQKIPELFGMTYDSYVYLLKGSQIAMKSDEKESSFSPDADEDDDVILEIVQEIRSENPDITKTEAYQVGLDYGLTAADIRSVWDKTEA